MEAFQKQYGMLKGWQWAGVIGGLLAVYLYVHKRSQAKAAGTSTNQAGQGLDASGNPIPGSSVLEPIIIQMGPPSQPTGAVKPPVIGSVKPPVHPPKPKPRPAPKPGPIRHTAPPVHMKPPKPPVRPPIPSPTIAKPPPSRSITPGPVAR